jgi:hypothetical protein
VGQQQVVVGGLVGLQHLRDALGLNGLAQHAISAKRKPVAFGQLVVEPVVRVRTQHVVPTSR